MRSIQNHQNQIQLAALRFCVSIAVSIFCFLGYLSDDVKNIVKRSLESACDAF